MNKDKCDIHIEEELRNALADCLIEAVTKAWIEEISSLQ